MTRHNNQFVTHIHTRTLTHTCTGITPLFLAARGGHLELLKALVRKGGDPNTLGASQRIGPLHWAAHKEHEEIALFLIENHGDLMLQDKEGRTPLSMASPELATKMIGMLTDDKSWWSFTSPSPPLPTQPQLRRSILASLL